MSKWELLGCIALNRLLLVSMVSTIISITASAISTISTISTTIPTTISTVTRTTATATLRTATTTTTTSTALTDLLAALDTLKNLLPRALVPVHEDTILVVSTVGLTATNLVEVNKECTTTLLVGMLSVKPVLEVSNHTTLAEEILCEAVCELHLITELELEDTSLVLAVTSIGLNLVRDKITDELKKLSGTFRTLLLKTIMMFLTTGILLCLDLRLTVLVLLHLATNLPDKRFCRSTSRRLIGHYIGCLKSECCFLSISHCVLKYKSLML
jgi:hypothetical protein